MKLKIIVLFAVISVTANIMAQSINFRFSTYFYGWQRIDSLSDESSAKTTHVRGYQNLLLSVTGSKWSFNTLASLEEDLANKIDDGFNYRFYNAYISGSNLFDRLDLKLGRQNLFAGVGRGTMDGLYMKLKAGKNKEYQFAVYGGSIAPYTYDFEDYPDIKDNYMAGAHFSYFGVKDLMLGLSYSMKNAPPPSYSAYRLDSSFTINLREITFDGPIQQSVGFDFSYVYKNKHSFFGKVYFDIGMEEFYRREFNASVTLTDNFRLSAGYLYRQPQITYNSIFWVFNGAKNFNEIEGGMDYILKNGMNIYARIGTVFYEKSDLQSASVPEPKNYSLKIQGGVSHPMYGLSYIRYMGYTGESDGVSGYYQRQLMKDKLSTSLSLSYSNYRLGDYDTEKVNSLAGSLGFTYRPMPQVSVDIQGQYLINRIYKGDARFLIGLNYWFFKNFK